MEPLWNKTYEIVEGDEDYSCILDCGDGRDLLVGSCLPFDSMKYNFFTVLVNRSGVKDWSNGHGGWGDDVAPSAAVCPDGGFLLAGWSTTFSEGDRDLFLVKLDGEGRRIWRAVYGWGGDDWACAVAPCGEEGFLVAGTTNSTGAGGYDLWVLRIDGDGKLEWNRTYGDAGNEVCLAAAPDGEGGLVLAGYASSPGSGGNLALAARIDGDGSLRWIRNYTLHKGFCGEAGEGAGGWCKRLQNGLGKPWEVKDRFEAVVSCPGGGFLLAGASLHPITYACYDAWALRVDDLGEPVWSRSWGDATFLGASLAEGGFLLTGYREEPFSSMKQAFLVRLDEEGSSRWSGSYGRWRRSEWVSAAVPLPNRSFMVAGSTPTSASGDRDGWLLFFSEGLEPEAPVLQAVDLVSGNDAVARWTPSEDPDGEVAFYEVEAQLEEGYWFWQRQVWRTPQTSQSLINMPEGDWRVRVRACDCRGLRGPWSGGITLYVEEMEWQEEPVDDREWVASEVWTRSCGDENGNYRAVGAVRCGDAYIAVGYASSGEGCHCLLVKVSSEGEEEWRLTIEDTNMDPSNPFRCTGQRRGGNPSLVWGQRAGGCQGEQGRRGGVAAQL